MKEIDQIKKLCNLYKFRFVRFEYTEAGVEIEIDANKNVGTFSPRKYVKLTYEGLQTGQYVFFAKPVFLKLSHFYENILPILEVLEVSEDD